MKVVTGWGGNPFWKVSGAVEVVVYVCTVDTGD
jgi:hypothetical protein